LRLPQGQLSPRHPQTLSANHVSLSPRPFLSCTCSQVPVARGALGACAAERQAEPALAAVFG